jgi:hypothetical protein
VVVVFANLVTEDDVIKGRLISCEQLRIVQMDINISFAVNIFKNYLIHVGFLFARREIFYKEISLLVNRMMNDMRFLLISSS